MLDITNNFMVKKNTEHKIKIFMFCKDESSWGGSFLKFCLNKFKHSTPMR